MSDLAEVLEAVHGFNRRYVVMDDAQAIAMSLWVFHTHVIDAADYTPYIYVTSAERESGKSRLKEAVELLVLNPIPTSNVSPAALFRLASLEDGPPATFLVDEVDEIFSPKSERSELRGLLNAGFHRGDHAIRMVGEGAKQFPQRFPVFCAKLLAGKNSAALGDTLESRCIRIELKRKTREEEVERFRRREVEQEATYIAETLRSLGSFYVDRLALARPLLPEELSDRQQDVWEPLLAIAELAGEGWPARTRSAAVALATGAVSEESLSIQLLADCRQVFDGLERVSTARLIELLCLVEESPWGEKWWDTYKGEAKSGAARNMGWHLKRYRIHSETLRFDDGQKLKGFRREHFEDAFERYLPPLGDLTRGIRGNPHGQRDSGPSRPVAEPSFATDPERAQTRMNTALQRMPRQATHEEGVKRMAKPETTAGRPLPPGLGDEMYPVLIANAVRDGHITKTEAEEPYALHNFVAGEERTAA
jgi:hypothetical protein